MIKLTLRAVFNILYLIILTASFYLKLKLWFIIKRKSWMNDFKKQLRLSGIKSEHVNELAEIYYKYLLEVEKDAFQVLRFIGKK